MNPQKTIKSSLIYSLCLPASFLYILLIVFTRNSFVGAVVGYLLLSISFGMFQSLFLVNKPYRTAFFANILIPTIAYFFFALLSLLVFYGLAKGIYTPLENGGLSIATSGSIIIEPLPYIGNLGFATGLLIYLIVIAIMVVFFGLTGVAGRHLGDEVIPGLLNHFGTKERTYQREQGGVLLKDPSMIGTKHDKVAVNITAIAALVSAFASLLAVIL